MSLNIGMLGLDTSHVKIFTDLLNNNQKHYNNVKVTIASPFPSYDLDLSIKRVDEYTTLLENNYNVIITESIEQVAEKSDAIMITSVDGRKHLELFKEVAPYKKPVFIDKPLATSETDANEIFSLSQFYKTPVMSSSSLRYADSLQKQLLKTSEPIKGIYLNGPLPFIEKMPYYFWYGIHMVEMLFAIMGPNYRKINVHGNKLYDVITTEWDDGRFGIIHGDHQWHGKFEAFLHYENGTIHLPIYKDEKSYYASLLEKIITFFETGYSIIPQQETLRIIRFIEEANELKVKYP